MSPDEEEMTSAGLEFPAVPAPHATLSAGPQAFPPRRQCYRATSDVSYLMRPHLRRAGANLDMQAARDVESSGLATNNLVFLQKIRIKTSVHAVNCVGRKPNGTNKVPAGIPGGQTP